MDDIDDENVESVIEEIEERRNEDHKTPQEMVDDVVEECIEECSSEDDVVSVVSGLVDERGMKHCQKEIYERVCEEVDD